MKLKIKSVYKNKVEPTLTFESNNSSEEVKNQVNSLIDKIFDDTNDLSGVFISRED